MNEGVILDSAYVIFPANSPGKTLKLYVSASVITRLIFNVSCGLQKRTMPTCFSSDWVAFFMIQLDKKVQQYTRLVSLIPAMFNLQHYFKVKVDL